MLTTQLEMAMTAMYCSELLLIQALIDMNGLNSDSHASCVHSRRKNMVTFVIGMGVEQA